jgi:hypothetical protein
MAGDTMTTPYTYDAKNIKAMIWTLALCFTVLGWFLGVVTVAIFVSIPSTLPTL